MKHLVCIADGPWIATNKPVIGTGPAKGEIVTVINIWQTDGKTVVRLKDYEFHGNSEAWYNLKWFREVDSAFGQYCEDTYLALAQIEEAIKEGAI